jgi:alginate O-acetyltransferase complex protein AlgJ
MKKINIFLFLCVCFSHIIFSFFSQHKSISLNENRVLADIPEIKADYVDYFDAWKSYINDQFFLREKLLFSYSYMSYFLFNKSISQNCLIGRDGWFFLGDDSSRKYFMNTDSFSSSELLEWKNHLERKKVLASKFDIPYVFIISPNKETVYPEFYPEHIKKINKSSLLDQLHAFMSNSSYNLFNFTDILANQKIPTYFKTDHHWNEYGAYIAASYAIKTFNSFKPLYKLHSYNFKNKIMPGGDLINGLKLNKYISENYFYYPVINTNVSCQEEIIEIPGIIRTKNHQTIERVCDNESDKTLIIFQDSFGLYFKSFFDKNFKKVIYIWDYPSISTMNLIIELFSPSAIIEQRVERHLKSFPPTDVSGL